MGDPQFRDPSPDLDVHRERLVVVSPFYVDTHEVTVAEARVGAYTPGEWSPSGDPNEYDYWCTYTSGPSADDPADSHAAMVANCMPFESAGPYCRRLGKDLPSEAQFEFAASGRGREQAFAWGNDEPECDDAVWGWGGEGQTEGYDSECRTSSEAIGVRPPGSGRRDRVLFGDVEVMDLAGNVSEWTRDRFSLPDEAYWSMPGVFVDPVADIASASQGDHLHAVRGGAFHDPPLLLRAAYRLGAPDNRHTVFFKVGWRCIRPGM
jgi:formylglycine-generating enzyme required for sulfatase activity